VPDALQAPVDTVLWHGEKTYCLLFHNKRWEAREVKIGSTDDTYLVLQSGLEEGERVVRNAQRYRQQVVWP
jgi:hypothetical protein